MSMLQQSTELAPSPHDLRAAGDEAARQISMAKEVQRKLIHLCSLSIPLLAIRFDRWEMLRVIAPLAALSLIVEFLRRRNKAVENLLQRMFGSMLRPHETSAESRTFNGATWVLVSATLCLLVFPQVVMVTGFTVLIISDTLAALVGRAYGRHKFLSKSLEGTTTFALSAMAISVVMWAVFAQSPLFIVIGVVASIVAALVEAMSVGGRSIDDNLSIPFSFGLVLWGGMALLHI